MSELKSRLIVSGEFAPLSRTMLSVWLVELISPPSESNVTSLMPTMRLNASLSSDSAIICQLVPPDGVVPCSTKVMSTVTGVPSES